MLVVEIVGVLPDVERQQRHQVGGERRIGIWCVYDAQSAAVEHQPGPAAGEMSARRRHELLSERSLTAEAVLDEFRDRPVRLAATSRAHALPEERMVPRLGGGVEECLAVPLGARPDDLLERRVLERCAFHQRAGLVHVCGVVVVVVRRQGAPGQMRFQGVEGIRQRRQRHVHVGLHQVQIECSVDRNLDKR